MLLPATLALLLLFHNNTKLRKGLALLGEVLSPFMHYKTHHAYNPDSSKHARDPTHGAHRVGVGGGCVGKHTNVHHNL